MIDTLINVRLTLLYMFIVKAKNERYTANQGYHIQTIIQAHKIMKFVATVPNPIIPTDY